MPTSEPKSRWFHFSPDRFVIGLLAVECLLWLSDRFQWFGFNHRKGWTVLIAVAAVAVAALVMLLWWAAGLIFRWRFQFGIRTLLVFCLASSIAAGWLAVEMQQARQQAALVVWVSSLGGEADYDWQLDMERGMRPNAQPKWLRNLLGVDFFSEVSEVVFWRSRITDAELEKLSGLTTVREITLFETDISDAGLENLKELTQLQQLILNGTKVTDAGVNKLQKALPTCLIIHIIR